MGNKQDFVIENGVLTKYTGPGGDVTIPEAVRYEELLRLMFAEKMIPQKDVALLLEECDRQKDTAAKAAVLEYAHKSFDAADPCKKYKL